MSACQKNRSVWERSVISTRCCYNGTERRASSFSASVRVHRHESTRLMTMLSDRTRQMFDDVSLVLRGNAGCCTSMSTGCARALLQSSVGHLQTITPDAWSRCVCNRRCINKVGQKWAEWMIVCTEGQNGAWRGLSCCPGAAGAEELDVLRQSSRWSAVFVCASGFSQPSCVPAVDFWWIPPDVSAYLLNVTEPQISTSWIFSKSAHSCGNQHAGQMNMYGDMIPPNISCCFK